MISKKIKQILRPLPFYNTAKGFYYFSKNFYRKTVNSAYANGYIFLYHRVAVSHNDPSHLAVSPENFRQQLKYLKEHFKIAPLSAIVNELKNKRIENNTIAITFDDGYADNLYEALPILENYSIPATIFVTTGKLNEQSPFYWDQMVLPSDRGKPMTRDELQSLSKNPLIEIGAHTLTHPKLSALSQEKQTEEVVENKKILECIINKKVSGFAYPFGNYGSFDKLTREIVIKAGFDYACANFPGRIHKSSDIHALPRYIIRNWGMEEFKKHLESFI